MCGAGDDELDDDLTDPVSDCDVVAPEGDVAPELSPRPYEIGRTINAGARGVVTGATTVTITWQSCSEFFCEPVSTADEYVIAPGDAGKRIHAHVQASNRTGSSPPTPR